MVCSLFINREVDLITRFSTSKDLVNELVFLAGYNNVELSDETLLCLLYYVRVLFDLRKALEKQGKPIPSGFPGLTYLDLLVFLRIIEKKYKDLESLVEYCDTVLSIDDYGKKK
jgi:hypothetical protein